MLAESYFETYNDTLDLQLKQMVQQCQQLPICNLIDVPVVNVI